MYYENQKTRNYLKGSSATSYLNEEEKQTSNYSNEREQKSEDPNIDKEFVEDVLKETRILIGNGDGSEYVLQPWLSEEVGLKVEKLSGIILKRREDGKFDPFLGGGAFGKFYVVLKKSKKSSKNEEEICGMKVIVGNLEENAIEAKM